MTMTRKDEERYLDADERELVAKTHHPGIAALADEELPDLKKRLRERRNRARDIAARQRREIRGKAKRPRGAEATRDDSGSKLKLAVLAQAMKRLNNEATRRRETSARDAMVSGMREALERKRADAGSGRPASRTSRKGMAANPNARADDLARPMEAGRVSQQVKKAQAKRDAR